jgi:predicted glycogen debranching enzyme
MKIKLKRDEILDLQRSLKKEYLLTNSRGGYSSSTILDCHTRKYHGLLVLPVKGTGKVFNLLSKLEVNAVINKKDFHLSTNKFPGVYHHTGHKYVESFEYDDFPVTNYFVGDARIRKSILMPENEDAVYVKYEVLESSKPILLQATPLFAYRDYHSLSKENMNIAPRTFFEPNGFKFDPYPNLPATYLQTSIKSHFYPSPEWYRNFEYLKERHRGYDYQEDLFSPGRFELKVKEGQAVIFRAGLESCESSNIRTGWIKEFKRIEKENLKIEEVREPVRTLKKSVKHFLVNQNKNNGIIAGYHWFGEWGRDTFIAFAGTTLVNGMNKEALNILKKYTDHLNQGLIPNMVNEEGGHAYNSADASLLYFWATQKYLEYTKDKVNIKKYILPALTEIVSSILEQRNPILHLGEHGFIYQGNDTTNYTWMDANVGGRAVTPRNGAAVEINALWYNALKFLINDFGKDIDKELKSKIEEQSKVFEANFQSKFFCPDDVSLVDVFKNDSNKSHKIRPNQLFALGLPYTCIDEENAKMILETMRSHLVTEYGIRTLSPRNPNYKFEYKGDQAIRDAAYHNGMVWPWLIGIYVDALLKYQKKSEVRKFVKNTFRPLWEEQFQMYGLNQISEIFRPSPEHVAKGCFAQAWSVSEVLRVLDTLKI